MKEILLLITVMFLTSCAGHGIKTETGNPNITLQNVENIQRGVTTREQVLSMFGEPISKTSAGVIGTIWTYSRTTSRLQDMGFFKGGVQQDIDSVGLSVVFDDNGVVKDYSYTSISPMQETRVSRF